MARPLIEIDPARVLELASLGCKNTEIAVLIGCSVDTIETRFPGELKKGRETLRMSLRQWQLKAAKNGNATMLVWLGKQMLGQTDKTELEISGSLGHHVLTEEEKIEEKRKKQERLEELLRIGQELKDR